MFEAAKSEMKAFVKALFPPRGRKPVNPWYAVSFRLLGPRQPPRPEKAEVRPGWKPGRFRFCPECQKEWIWRRCPVCGILTVREGENAI